MPLLKLSQQQFLDLLPLALYLCGPQGLITQCNRSAILLWGRTPSSRRGDRFTGAFRLYDSRGNLLEPAASPMARVLSEELPQLSSELGIERPDGSRIVVLSNVALLRDRYKRVIGAVDVFQDITERKRYEEARRVADRMSAADRMAASVAREMQGPLGSLAHLLELLCRDASLGADARSHVQLAQQELSCFAKIAREMPLVSGGPAMLPPQSSSSQVKTLTHLRHRRTNGKKIDAPAVSAPAEASRASQI